MKYYASILPALLLLTSACGYTDSGDGSKTLQVDAEMSYRPSDNNLMRLNVTIEKSGTEVEDAVVKITDDESGDIYELTHNHHGEYFLSVEGYHRKLRLEIERGSDKLSAQLQGPGPHIITYPENESLVKRSDLGAFFTLVWRVDDGLAADQVFLRLKEHHKEFDLIDNDPGDYNIIRTIEMDDGEEEAQVKRTNITELAGGTTGSTFSIGYDARNEFVIE
ncbi:hypothetical protein KAI87_15355 [Myxococcota bacterium]|nr:hypothetical protein [Myxococcota bacterium]